MKVDRGGHGVPELLLCCHVSFWSQLNEWYESEVPSFQRLPFLVSVFSGKLSRPAYVAFLREYYHFVKSAGSFYGLAAGRVPTEFPRVREWLFKTAYREHDHYEFIIKDLEALGVSSPTVKESQPGPAIDALIGYNIYFVEHRHPVGALSMPYLMGKLSTGFSLAGAEKLKAALGIGEAGASFFFAHGHLDRDQPEDIGSVIQAITEKDVQAEIFQNAKAVFMLYRNFFQTLET